MVVKARFLSREFVDVTLFYIRPRHLRVLSMAGRSSARHMMVCSTPHALSPDALSPCALSPRTLSPNGPRNIMKNQASQVEFFNCSLSKRVFLTSFIKETRLAPELFTGKLIFT